MNNSVQILAARELGKRIEAFGQTLDILSGVSFHINQGEAVAVVGPSGSGKSTLLGLLAGLDVPSAGEVWLNGESLFALNEDQRAMRRGRDMGFVFQSFHLLPYLNALENTMLPLEFSGVTDARERALQMLARVGLEHRTSHFPRQLSGGEQQRVALARAFIGHPKILLADEPTGNLDADNGARVIDLMFEMNRQMNTTLVLVTHDKTLANRCERMFKMEAGRLVA